MVLSQERLIYSLTSIDEKVSEKEWLTGFTLYDINSTL